MKSTFRGHSWAVRGRTDATIVSACEAVFYPGRLTTCIQHSFWALDYCLNEGSLVRTGSSRSSWIERGSNTAHLYPPGVEYWEDTRHLSVPSHSLYVCFVGTVPDDILKLVDSGKKCVRIRDPEKQMESLLQHAVDIGQKEGDQGFWKAQANLCQLIDLILRSRPASQDMRMLSGTWPSTKRDDLVSSVREYIRKNLCRTISLQEIAHHTNVSISTLSHQYRKETGETAMNTHEKLRMQKICQLLRMGEPLKVIAATMGFGDIYHLSKYFKRLSGISPRQYLSESSSHRHDL